MTDHGGRPASLGAGIHALIDQLLGRARLHRARLYGGTSAPTIGAVVDGQTVAAGDVVLGTDAVLRRADGALTPLTVGDAVLVTEGVRYGHCLWVCAPPGDRLVCVVPAPRLPAYPDPGAAFWWSASLDRARLLDPAGAACAHGGVVQTWRDALASATPALAMTSGPPTALPTLDATDAAAPFVRYRGVDTAAPRRGAYSAAGAAGGRALRCRTNGGYTTVAYLRFDPAATSGPLQYATVFECGLDPNYTIQVHAVRANVPSGPSVMLALADTSGGFSNYNATPMALAIGVWYFVAVRSTATRIQFWWAADAAAPVSTSASDRGAGPPGDLPVLNLCNIGGGVHGTSSAYLGVDVREVAFWDRPLSDAAVDGLRMRLAARY